MISPEDRFRTVRLALNDKYAALADQNFEQRGRMRVLSSLLDEVDANIVTLEGLLDNLTAMERTAEELADYANLMEGHVKSPRANLGEEKAAAEVLPYSRNSRFFFASAKDIVEEFDEEPEFYGDDSEFGGCVRCWGSKLIVSYEKTGPGEFETISEPCPECS